MTWTSWTTLVPLLVLVCSVLAWSQLVDRRAALLHLLVAAACALLYTAVYVDLDLSNLSPHTIYTNAAAQINFENLDRFCEENASMILFGAAVVWYASLLPPAPCLNLPCSTGLHDTVRC